MALWFKPIPSKNNSLDDLLRVCTAAREKLYRERLHPLH
jgi:hypothetical protein